MSERRIPPDPSMEEILASIRRIISDDGTRPGAPPAPAHEPAPAEAAIAMPLSPPGGAVVNILRPEPSPRPEPSARPEFADERPLYRPRVAAADGGAAADLVSPGVAAEAAAAIAAIGRLDMGRAETGQAEAVAPGSDLGQRAIGGGTMDDLVRELLRPMLKEWLDARLPGLVEAVVREEIERIVRRSNLR